MNRKLDRGRVFPAILFGSLIIVGVFTVYIGTQLPNDTTQPKELLAHNQSSSPEPTELPKIAMQHYSSKPVGISFDYPSNMKVLDEDYKSLSIGVTKPILVFSKVEDVYISRQSLCSLAKKTECIYDSYSSQSDPFVATELGEQKAKSFYYRDKDGKNWHIISLSVYKEFQVKMEINSEEDDKIFQEVITSFAFN